MPLPCSSWTLLMIVTKSCSQLHSQCLPLSISLFCCSSVKTLIPINNKVNGNYNSTCSPVSDFLQLQETLVHTLDGRRVRKS